MSSDPDRIIKQLKYLRGVFSAFYDLLIKVEELERKYDVKFSEVTNLNMTSGQTVDILSKKLTLEKLGLLFLLSADVQSVGDFNQYFVSDAKKQSEIRAALKEALTKFDKVVEGL